MTKILIGWDLPAKLVGLIFKPWNFLLRSKELRTALARGEAVERQVQQLGLHEQVGRSQWAYDITTLILENYEPNIDDVSELPFHAHLWAVISQQLEYEELFEVPLPLSGAEARKQTFIWKYEDRNRDIRTRIDDLDGTAHELAVMFDHLVAPLIKDIPSLLELPSDEGTSLDFHAPVSMSVNEFPELLERAVQLPFAPELEEHKTTERLKARLEHNMIVVSGGLPSDPSTYPKILKLPTKAFGVSGTDLIKSYLQDTPLFGLFDYLVPIQLPEETRFQHHHIVAGSGHGKTQTLQHLILHDLQKVALGKSSIVVLDSQGDLIQNIRQLALFAPGSEMAERLIIIDPTDVEYPVALNLFDVGMERINAYSQLDRERMVNSVLELYDFVLGSLLDAQMTQKQSVIFRYITRLMLHIPGATIITLRELLEEGGADKYRDHINKLEGSAKAFFDTEFDSREFVQTKRQVVRRLWGILENQTFERMFSHPKNKLDIFTEMNAGKVILINTSKDLLKESGTEIFGRFFIGMIAQAAQERAIIPKDERMPTIVYVDEAQDYFDRNIGIILEQARKYKVGMVLAHQYLGQLDTKLQEGVFANTSIKFAGGVSSKDAKTLSGEMRCGPYFVEDVEPLSFAAYIRGTTKSAVKLSISYGAMERLPKLDEEDLTAQRDAMRLRYATHYKQTGSSTRSADQHAYSGEVTNSPSHPSDPASGHVSKNPNDLSDEASDWPQG